MLEKVQSVCKIIHLAPFLYCDAAFKELRKRMREFYRIAKLTFVDILTKKRYINDMEEIKEYIKRNKKNTNDRSDLVLIDNNVDELNAEADGRKVAGY
jgi:hypothetical protein